MSKVTFELLTTLSLKNANGFDFENEEVIFSIQGIVYRALTPQFGYYMCLYSVEFVESAEFRTLPFQMDRIPYVDHWRDLMELMNKILEYLKFLIFKILL